MSSTPDRWQVHHHRDVSGGAARAAVFGVSDGLVSNVALILGVAGAGPSASTVLVAGMAGLVAGAVSMAAGEYVSMQAQKELVERELSIEADNLARHPEAEVRELTNLYVSRGIDKETAERVSRQLMSDPEQALEIHAREELGLHPEAVGSPRAAALSSFAAFSVGALVPVVPWMVAEGRGAVMASLVAAVIFAVGVGLLLARFTERPALPTAFRQVVLMLASCAATYGIGALVGQAVG